MAVEKDPQRKLLKGSRPFVLFMLLLLTACGGRVYHEYRPISNCEWSCNDTLLFEYGGYFAGNEAAGVLLTVEARTDASYPYKNLAVRAECIDASNGESVSVDTLCCVVYGDNGRREGASAGLLYQVSSAPVFVDGVCGDSLLIKIAHIMDSSLLQGVSDVGVRLETSSVRGRHQSGGM